nr:hypothetical protein [uncultured Campylobacter sp.]
MKLQNTVKLLKEFGEVKEHECGASVEIGAKNCGADTVLYLFEETKDERGGIYFSLIGSLKQMRERLQ